MSSDPAAAAKVAAAQALHEPTRTSDYPAAADPASLSTPATRDATINSEPPRSLSRPLPRLEPEATPERIGRYAIRRQLGQGGFGRVFLAWDESLCREVALKLPHVECVAAPGQQELFLAEARMAARLRHPGVVVVHDVGIDESFGGYVVYEYVPGPTLRDRVTGQPWPADKAVDIVLALARALHAAHQQGLVHRDLKPGNILLDAADHPRIADFGLAVDDQSQRGLRGEVAGTLAYMSPEQIRGETHHLDGRTDLWSLGVILYELLAGKRPFGGSQAELSDEILARDPRPLRQINERVSRRLEAICLRCLAKSVGQRYASALDLIEDLEALQREPSGSSRAGTLLPSELPAASQRESPSSNSSRAAAEPASAPGAASPWPWIGGGIAALLLALAGAWGTGAFSSGTPSPTPPTPGPPRPLEADVWHSLLDERPRPLVWEEHQPASRWTNDKDELFISSHYPAMFELHKTDERDYQIRVTLQQTPWVGRLGIFLGHQDDAQDPTIVRYEVLALEPINTRDNAQFGIVRKIVVQERGEFQRIRDARDLAMARVNQPGPGPHHLACEVRGGRLAAVSFDGQPCRDLVNLPPELAAEGLECRGRLGVYLSQSSGVFRQPMFRFTREKAP
jgi:serine/threonine protein kinase